MIEYTLLYVNEITDPCSNLGAGLANLLMEGASGISTCGVHILTKTNVANAGGLAQL